MISPPENTSARTSPRRFTLTTSNADAWRNLLLAKGPTPSLSDCENITLPGALELLATSVALRDSCELFEEITAAARARAPVWQSVMMEWADGPDPNPSNIHGTRHYEFFRLRAIDDKTGLNFSLFLERFCRSMRARDFPAGFSNALGKVLDEMADNVIQHSGAQRDGFSGIAGYHVEKGHAAIAVVDVGRGILSTLRESPEWSDLLTARDALRAIVSKGASSRTGQGPGEGFKQLFAALLDRNCVGRLRSDDSALVIADGENAREGGEIRSPTLAGVQISLNFAVRTRAKETAIGA